MLKSNFEDLSALSPLQKTKCLVEKIKIEKDLEKKKFILKEYISLYTELYKEDISVEKSFMLL